MGCRIIVGREDSGNGRECAVLYCSTTGQAFGPVLDSLEEAEEFMEWLESDNSRWVRRQTPRRENPHHTCDPRAYSDMALRDLYDAFRTTKTKTP
jgi:hypothetical protein